MEKQLTSLGKAVYNTEENSKLDGAVKNLLSQKPILAFILKYAVKEFADYSVAEIIPMIDQVHVAGVAMEPGATNDLITGEPQESKIPGESVVTYDVRFIATLPGSGNPSEYNLIIDVEAQAQQDKSYDVETRAIAYCGRMISDQMGNIVQHSHYENLQKVYSIWVCMNCAKRDANTISEYGISQVNHAGDFKGKPKVDLLSAIIIRLPKDDEWEKAENPATTLTSMLSTLLSNRIAPEEKINELENKYGIETTEEIREEVNKMCDYSSAISEEAYDKGQAEGQIRGAINLAKKMNWTDKQIEDYLIETYGLSEEKASEYMEPVTA